MKLKYYETLPTFAFNLKLRPYNEEGQRAVILAAGHMGVEASFMSTSGTDTNVNLARTPAAAQRSINAAAGGSLLGEDEMSPGQALTLPTFWLILRGNDSNSTV